MNALGILLEVVFWASVVGIAYTYAGYPLLIAAFAHLRRVQAPTQQFQPSVTLLIAAYNEEDSVAAKLRNTLGLDYPPEFLQVIVATDGSTDATVEIVGRFLAQGVTLSHSPARAGKAGAIDRAMRLATGDIVVFSDANNLYDRSALRDLVQPFVDPSVGAVCGTKHIIDGDGPVGDSEGAYWKYETWIKRQESRFGSTVAVLGEALAIRRELMPAMPADVINDDFFIVMTVLRGGRSVKFAPRAVSRERIAPTADDEIARRARMGAGMYQALARPRTFLPWKRPVVCWQLVSHKLMRPLIAVWMLGCLLSSTLLALTGLAAAPQIGPVSSWTALVGLQCVFYVAASIGSWWSDRAQVPSVLYLPAYLVDNTFAALQGLLHYSSGRQTVRWTRAPRR